MAIYLRNATSILRSSTRSLATIVSPSVPNGSSAPSIASIPAMDSIAEHDGPLRPHLNLPVNPNHGLYGFFRRKTNENSHSKLRGDGQAEYVALEPPNVVNSSGRSWNVSELRRKSFKDLHTLWYILLRERNVLATQKAERKRLTIYSRISVVYPNQMQKCRKSMARIKAVLSERRNAYIQAARLRRALRRNPELLEPTKVTGDKEGAMLEVESDWPSQTGKLEDKADQTRLLEGESKRAKTA